MDPLVTAGGIALIYGMTYGAQTGELAKAFNNAEKALVNYAYYIEERANLALTGLFHLDEASKAERETLIRDLIIAGECVAIEYEEEGSDPNAAEDAEGALSDAEKTLEGIGERHKTNTAYPKPAPQA